jgi:hypothetical protein
MRSPIKYTATARRASTGKGIGDYPLSNTSIQKRELNEFWIGVMSASK